MKFNSTFPSIPLKLIRADSGIYLYQHELSDRLKIKSPLENPINTEFSVLIGEETGTYRNKVKYIRRINILLFPPGSELPKFNLAISILNGILKFDRPELAYAITLGGNQYLKIEVF